MAIALAVVEAALMFAALFALLLHSSSGGAMTPAEPAVGALVFTVASVGAFYCCDLYDLRVAHSVRACAPRVMKALGLALLAVGVVATVRPTPGLGDGMPLVRVLLVTVVLSLGGRACCYGFIRRRPYGQTAIVLGGGHVAGMLLQEIAARPQLRWAVGLVTETALVTGRPPFRYPVLGGVDRLGRIVEKARPHRILVALDEHARVAVMPVLLEARSRGIVVEDAVDAYERITGKLAIEALPPAALVFSRGFRVARGYASLGHVISLVVAAAGLILLAPMLAAIALAVKFDSPGPVFFRQQRVGLHGRRFWLIKFRTMRPVAAEVSAWVRDNEDRITRVGRVLRRFRLDELPQFINILRGDMNLVGPRPHPVCNYELFERAIPYYTLRAAVRPGVTGWAQVRYGYANNLEEETEKMRYDLYYVKHLSVWLDIRILVDTVKMVVFGLGSDSTESASFVDESAHPTTEHAA